MQKHTHSNLFYHFDHSDSVFTQSRTSVLFSFAFICPPLFLLNSPQSWTYLVDGKGPALQLWDDSGGVVQPEGPTSDVTWHRTQLVDNTPVVAVVFWGISQDAILGHVCIISWLSFCLTMALLEMAPRHLEVSYWIVKKERDKVQLMLSTINCMQHKSHQSPSTKTVPPENCSTSYRSSSSKVHSNLCERSTKKALLVPYEAWNPNATKVTPEGILHWLFSII